MVAVSDEGRRSQMPAAVVAGEEKEWSLGPDNANAERNSRRHVIDAVRRTAVSRASDCACGVSQLLARSKLRWRVHVSRPGPYWIVENKSKRLPKLYRCTKHAGRYLWIKQSWELRWWVKRRAVTVYVVGLGRKLACVGYKDPRQDTALRAPKGIGQLRSPANTTTPHFQLTAPFMSSLGTHPFLCCTNTILFTAPLHSLHHKDGSSNLT